MAEARAFPSDTLAPWAEVVPRAAHTTVDELLSMTDDGWRYEVVEGVLVRVAGSGKRATRTAARLLARLLTYVEDSGLGVVTGADGVYTFFGAETGLLPDVGFYTVAHDALITDEDKPIPFAPDLAVEVASPSQSADDMAAKARLYIRGGTQLVWVVWPERRQVDVWRHGNISSPTVTLTVGDMLDGEDLVPGFALPVATIFADPLG